MHAELAHATSDDDDGASTTVAPPPLPLAEESTASVRPVTAVAAVPDPDLDPTAVARSARRQAGEAPRPHISRVKAVLVCCDAAAAACGMLLAAAILRWLLGTTLDSTALVAAASVPVWPILFAQQGLYQSRRLSRRMEELRRIVNSVLAGVLVLAGLSVLFQSQLSRGWLGLVFLCVTTLVYSEREVARRVIASRRAKGRMTRRVVVVGQNAEAAELAGMLENYPQHGYEVVGFVADPAVPVVDLRKGRPLGPYLGSPQDVLDLVRATGATGVIVATTSTDLESANRLIRELTREGLFVELTSAMRDISPSRISLRSLGPYPLLAVEPVAELSWRRVAKRCFDVVVASLMLLVSMPLIVIAALMIRIRTGPGILFRQERVGLGGRTFTVYKLRTMVPGAEDQLEELRDRNEAPGPLFKITDDPRVTSVGRFLRRFSIDELPQLYNVLIGDMSLVGPRPAIPSEAEEWDDVLRERLRVKPGITGEWQVSGRYEASIEEYARLDLHYVDNWSLVRDLVILLRTVPAVLSQRGAA